MFHSSILSSLPGDGCDTLVPLATAFPDSPCGANLEWSMSPEDADSLRGDDFSLAASRLSAPGAPVLVLRALVLTPGTTYNLQLRAVDLAGNEGVGSHQVTANRSPDGGRLEVSPFASARYNEEVTLSAVGFVDEHLPLTYRFAFRAATALHDYPLTREASEARTHTTTELPVGDVTLVAYVADFYGTEGASERAFTVLLPELADDSIQGAADFVMNEFSALPSLPDFVMNEFSALPSLPSLPSLPAQPSYSGSLAPSAAAEVVDGGNATAVLAAPVPEVAPSEVFKSAALLNAFPPPPPYDLGGHASSVSALQAATVAESLNHVPVETRSATIVHEGNLTLGAADSGGDAVAAGAPRVSYDLVLAVPIAQLSDAQLESYAAGAAASLGVPRESVSTTVSPNDGSSLTMSVEVLVPTGVSATVFATDASRLSASNVLGGGIEHEGAVADTTHSSFTSLSEPVVTADAVTFSTTLDESVVATAVLLEQYRAELAQALGIPLSELSVRVLDEGPPIQLAASISQRDSASEVRVARARGVMLQALAIAVPVPGSSTAHQAQYAQAMSEVTARPEQLRLATIGSTLSLMLPALEALQGSTSEDAMTSERTGTVSSLATTLSSLAEALSRERSSGVNSTTADEVGALMLSFAVASAQSLLAPLPPGEGVEIHEGGVHLLAKHGVPADYLACDGAARCYACISPPSPPTCILDSMGGIASSPPAASVSSLLVLVEPVPVAYRGQTESARRALSTATSSEAFASPAAFAHVSLGAPLATGGSLPPDSPSRVVLPRRALAEDGRCTTDMDCASVDVSGVCDVSSGVCACPTPRVGLGCARWLTCVQLDEASTAWRRDGCWVALGGFNESER